MSKTHLSFFGVMERRLRLLEGWSARVTRRERTLVQVYGLLEQARTGLARSYELLDRPVVKAEPDPDATSRRHPRPPPVGGTRSNS